MLKEIIFSDKEKLKILARTVAHYMGDGGVTNKYAAYFNKNETLLNNFEKDITILFEGVHITKGKYNSGTKLLQIHNKQIIQFLKELVSDYRSGALKLPEFIKSIELQKEFLKALFDDEGCVAFRIHKPTGDLKRNLSLASKSKKLIEDLKYVLETNFDIKCNKINEYIAKKWGKEYPIFTLFISGKENFVKFRDLINFDHPVKRERLNIMISSDIRK